MDIPTCVLCGKPFYLERKSNGATLLISPVEIVNGVPVSDYCICHFKARLILSALTRPHPTLIMTLKDGTWSQIGNDDPLHATDSPRDDLPTVEGALAEVAHILQKGRQAQ